jgi:hypothetical protein
VSSERGFKLVRLASGVHSVHSLEHRETLHPAIGPAAEAEALYVRQLRLVERLQRHNGEFVVWDVGLGAAANALAVLRAVRSLPCSVYLVSFDCTVEPLRFALQHRETLGYFDNYERPLRELIEVQRTEIHNGPARIRWDLQLDDFPKLLDSNRSRRREEADLPSGSGLSASSRRQLPSLCSPHAVLFDPYSPARNPAMWTLPLFTNLFSLLDPRRPCALTTYSRSTMLRVTLLAAGFFVGMGRATGRKEETTVAANTLELIEEPLQRDWLERARRSHSAEPLRTPVYQQAPLSPATWTALQRHSQFQDFAR